ETQQAFRNLNWNVECIDADVLEWLSRPAGQRFDVIVANLFLHHFQEEQLVELFRHAARQTSLFIALEPRRSAWSVTCSPLLRLLGCRPTTRHDALISIRAGFAGRELASPCAADGTWLAWVRRVHFAWHS